MEIIDTFASYEVGYGLVTALDIVSLHRGVQVAELCLVFEPSSPTLEVASKGKGHVKKYWARSRFWTFHGVYPLAEGAAVVRNRHRPCCLVRHPKLIL